MIGMGYQHVVVHLNATIERLHTARRENIDTIPQHQQ
jgi:hypothetical protein